VDARHPDPDHHPAGAVSLAKSVKAWPQRYHTAARRLSARMTLEVTVTTANVDDLRPLHTAAVDARNGYAEALENAESKDLCPLFREMILIHTQNADELKVHITIGGMVVAEEGSFMSSVHRWIIAVRARLGGLDVPALPGFIDGEKRNIRKYDAALVKDGFPKDLRVHLQRQRDRISKQISVMNSRIQS
jgi:uncharacterized protein (TIGR02284 family)